MLTILSDYRKRWWVIISSGLILKQQLLTCDRTSIANEEPIIVAGHQMLYLCFELTTETAFWIHLF